MAQPFQVHICGPSNFLYLQLTLCIRLLKEQQASGMHANIHTEKAWLSAGCKRSYLADIQIRSSAHPLSHVWYFISCDGGSPGDQGSSGCTACLW